MWEVLAVVWGVYRLWGYMAYGIQSKATRGYIISARFQAFFFFQIRAFPFRKTGLRSGKHFYIYGYIYGRLGANFPVRRALHTGSFILLPGADRKLESTYWFYRPGTLKEEMDGARRRSAGASPAIATAPAPRRSLNSDSFSPPAAPDARVGEEGPPRGQGVSSS